MTVRVTLDFESHDEALVFLARVSQTKVAAPAGTPASRPVRADTPVAATPSANGSTSRKPRNDAGKARGPHKQSSEGAGEPATPPITPAAGTPAPEEHKEPAAAGQPESQGQKPTVTEQTASTAAAPDEKDCQAAMTKVWEFAGKDQIPTCRTLLERFGVKRIGEIAADQRAGFIAKCEAVLKGEPV